MKFEVEILDGGNIKVFQKLAEIDEPRAAPEVVDAQGGFQPLFESEQRLRKRAEKCIAGLEAELKRHGGHNIFTSLTNSIADQKRYIAELEASLKIAEDASDRNYKDSFINYDGRMRGLTRIAELEAERDALKKAWALDLEKNARPSCRAPEYVVDIVKERDALQARIHKAINRLYHHSYGKYLTTEKYENIRDILTGKEV